jgi:hypothetical protein
MHESVGFEVLVESPIFQYGSILGKGLDALTGGGRSEMSASDISMLELTSMGEDSLQGGTGSMISAEVASVVLDPGSVDSPSAQGPLLKQAQLELGEKEVRAVEEALGGAGKVALGTQRDTTTPSLQQQAVADLLLAQGLRSRAIP